MKTECDTHRKLGRGACVRRGRRRWRRISHARSGVARPARGENRKHRMCVARVCQVGAARSRRKIKIERDPMRAGSINTITTITTSGGNTSSILYILKICVSRRIVQTDAIAVSRSRLTFERIVAVRRGNGRGALKAARPRDQRAPHSTSTCCDVLTLLYEEKKIQGRTGVNRTSRHSSSPPPQIVGRRDGPVFNFVGTARGAQHLALLGSRPSAATTGRRARGRRPPLGMFRLSRVYLPVRLLSLRPSNAAIKKFSTENCLVSQCSSITVDDDTDLNDMCQKLGTEARATPSREPDGNSRGLAWPGERPPT
ncbi:hypothetical protein EVAR_11841_1 [Eumeta japonica]|uniref:Uncharacterized protein n=1 Tax=Eumeta variegata TaxID=151549 RepID=A0A4C1YPC5_EUMVA|nr:hypothetical protein EVAR_11841_1 [Eumeta japonica]